MKKAKLDPFVLAILVSIFIAYFFPQWALTSSPIPLDLISTWGVSIVFFFYGLKLPPQQLKQGLSNWRVHLLVQASTFLIFPLLVLAIYPFFFSSNYHQWWLAFMFLAALPSTVSSSVVMVSLAKGNIVAAIFNSSLSGIIGIIISPLWMGLFLKHQQTAFDMSSIYSKLTTEILIPILLGLCCQGFWGNWARQNKRALSWFDKSMILLIVYKSFGISFDQGIFADLALKVLLLVFVAVVFLFFVMLWLTQKLGQLFRLNVEDSITLKFCGTKKSLVHGTVFSKLLFPAGTPLGLILLPLMIFHAFQIFWISLLASRLGEREIGRDLYPQNDL